MKKWPILWFIVLVSAAGLLAFLAPFEKTLGAGARVVYFHGAWVWVAMLAFLAASLAGILGSITQREVIHQWSLALGRTGLFFWITFLPMSLYVMQVNWNGLFLDEPRFRVPLNFAIVGLLLQIGLAFFQASTWSSIANIAFGITLFISMNNADAILHPDSPILNSGAREIQLYFLGLLILMACAAWQLALGWLQWEIRRKRKAK